MAKKDTIYALIRRGIEDRISRKLANYYTLSSLKKSSIEELSDRGFTESEAEKILSKMGVKVIKKKKKKKEIKEESEKDKAIKEFLAIKGIGESKARALYKAGFRSKLELRLSPIEVISAADNIGKKDAESIKEQLIPPKKEALKQFYAIGLSKGAAEKLWKDGFKDSIDVKLATKKEISKAVGMKLATTIKEKVGSIEIPRPLSAKEIPLPPSIEESKEKKEIRSRINGVLKKKKEFLPRSIIDELVNKLDRGIEDEKLNKIIGRIIDQYDRNSIDPSEACGIVGAQSIGEPGTQMSLSGDEKIIIKYGNEIKINEMGKFVDGLMDGFECKKIGVSDVCDLPTNVNIFVPSLNQREKIEWKRIISCSRHQSPKKLLKLTTRSGRKIIATDSHSFVIRNENRIIPISGKELKVGDRIPVIKKLPVHCINSLDFGKFLDFDQMKYADVKEGFIYSYPSRKPLPEKMELNHLSGWFIGAYLAEGNSTKYYTSISNVNEEFLSKVRKFADRYNLTHNEYDNYRGFAKGHDIRINSSLLSNFIKNMCNIGASKKKLPDFAYGANEDFVCGLLRGYFDGDGSISTQRKVIRVSSASKELIDGIALLLNRLGIFARKINQKEYGLSISYRYAPLFLEKIGSDIKSKRDRLKKLCEFNSLDSKSYDIVDMIPNFGDVFNEIADKINFPKRLVNNFTKRQRIGRKTLDRYINKFERMANEKGIDIERELKILRQGLNSDVLWDEIKSISYDDAPSEYVYDLSVDGLETFTTFDGIITHNTMRTFHYAGVAEINVTLGLPRLIEIVDARRAPSTPMMSVYLEGAYRANPDMASKMANKIEVTQLLNVADCETDIESMRIIVKPNERAMERRGIDRRVIVDRLKKIRGEVEDCDGGIVIVPKYKTYKEIQQLAERVRNAKIKGINGIKRAIVRKEKDECVIYTEGSNLEEVLKLDGVDATRTTTNDVRAIYKVLGIEAARNAIIHEAYNTLREQGLIVDMRHIMLVADVMTSTGVVRAVGRQGVSGEKDSVIARAAFEITINHLLRAAQKGEIDRLKGVTENVIVGRPINLGTGAVDLSVDVRKLGKNE